MLAMPVICCVSGDLPRSEVAAVMRETHRGLLLRAGRGRRGVPATESYVRMQYDRFVGGEPPAYEPDAAAVAAFSKARAWPPPSRG